MRIDWLCSVMYNNKEQCSSAGVVTQQVQITSLQRDRFSIVPADYELRKIDSRPYNEGQLWTVPTVYPPSFFYPPPQPHHSLLHVFLKCIPLVDGSRRGRKRNRGQRGGGQGTGAEGRRLTVTSLQSAGKPRTRGILPFNESSHSSAG